MTRRPKPPWCGHCDERTRLAGDPPERCPKCHPLSQRSPETGAPVILEGIISLADVQPRRVSWLWPGRFPLGHLVMLDGDPGVGKSTLALDFAARITAGRPWPDGEYCKRGNVLLLTAEEGLADTVLPRMLAAGGDPSRVVVLTHIPTEGGGRLPSLPADIPYIQEVITQRRVRLVIIDVLASYLGGDVNSHQDTDVRRALFPLFRMAEATRSTVLMLRHLNKQGSGNAMYRGGGSIGITGQARAVYLAARSPSDPDRRILAPVKLNLGPEPRALAYQLVTDEATGRARVQWAGEDPHSASELLSGPADPEEEEERDHVASWLQDYLFHAGGQAAAGDIFAAAAKHGVPKATVQRARKRAGVRFVRSGWQSGSIWQLEPDKMDQIRQESAPFASFASPSET